MRHSPPILVTGIHRSGTTWVGRMLAADAHTTYVSEPLNIFHRPGVFRVPVKHWYAYITDENEDEYLPAFEELLGFRYHFWPGIRSIRSHKHLVLMREDLQSFFIGRIQEPGEAVRERCVCRKARQPRQSRELEKDPQPGRSRACSKADRMRFRPVLYR
jgi:hypothetical protein